MCGGDVSQMSEFIEMVEIKWQQTMLHQPSELTQPALNVMVAPQFYGREVKAENPSLCFSAEHASVEG